MTAVDISPSASGRVTLRGDTAGSSRPVDWSTVGSFTYLIAEDPTPPATSTW
jgi:hypothetical protein